MRLSSLLRSIIVAGCLLFALPASAQQRVEQSVGPPSADNMVQAVITGPKDIAVGRTLLLDASFSRAEGEDVLYEWFIGDARQPISRSVEAVYTPERPSQVSFRLVVSAMVNGQRVSSEVLHVVTVYTRKIVVVADASVTASKLEAHKRTLSNSGVFLQVLHAPETAAQLGNEEVLTQLLTEQSNALVGADIVVLWTEGVAGMQAMLRTAQSNPELLAGFQQQTIVVVTDRSLGTIARTARASFGVLKPEQIILTRKEAVSTLFNTADISAFLQDLEQADIEYLRVDAQTSMLRPWNLLTELVNAMLAKGIPSQTVLLLLVLPVIATILAFLKQVIGITTFGLYTPSIIALSFLALGWPVGIFFLLFIVFTGYATRAIMRRWRLLYIPKVAIVLVVVSITLLLLMGASTQYGITFSRETIFILLIMSTLAESFLNLKTEQGWYSALLGIGETIGAALLCVFLVQWQVFQTTIIAYPELILLTIPVNIFLGRWTGLRLMEYFRFREVFRHLQEE